MAGLVLSDAAAAAMMRHARAMAAMSPPLESVGVLSAGRYIAAENQARDPHKAFRLDGAWVARQKNLEAIIHSHPGGPPCPSAHDMRQQQATALPWIIAVVPTASRGDIREEWFVFGEAPHLDLDAGYRHGVSDCYGLIRGWYWAEKSLLLPDYAREWEWWRGGVHSNLYLDYFADAGFRALEDAPPQRGDVFLAAVRSAVPNHAGIYLGAGLILHHLAGSQPAAPARVPRKEPAERWNKFITTWLRHQSAT